MSSSLTFRLSDIIPNQEALSQMGRRRYQKPNVFKSKGKRPEFFFRVRMDALVSDGNQRKTKRPMKTHYLGYVDESLRRRGDAMLSVQSLIMGTTKGVQ